MTSRPRHRRAECGAVLIEFFLIAMLLFTLTFGTIEMGMSWQDRLTIQTAARTGVRVGSNLGADSLTDYNTLLAVKSALADVGIGNVEYVVIYKSATANGAVPSTCVTSIAVVSVAATCNAYSGAQLASMTSANFGCGVGDFDLSWCPTTRQTLQALGPDYLGVWIRVRHNFVTGLFGTSMKITDSSVMRLEPLT